MWCPASVLEHQFSPGCFTPCSACSHRLQAQPRHFHTATPFRLKLGLDKKSSSRQHGQSCRLQASLADDRSQESEAAFSALQQVQGGRIGSEYGEGFVQFRLNGEHTHLDVDTLNERLKIKGAVRMRHAMRPDEAYGMIFNLDGVIADTRAAQKASWRRLAAEEGLPFPETGPERQLYDIRPERIITEVLQWTRDWGVAHRLAWRMASIYSEEFVKLEPLTGVTEWLGALATAKVPCALVSQMDRLSLRAALERMQLRTFFAATVTADDDMETISQRLLSAALKLGRPPNQCVVFESCPGGITAAHNCTMKAVAIQGTHRGYQLKQADLTCSSMAELTVYNVRRLFANRGAELWTSAQHRIGAMMGKPPGASPMAQLNQTAEQVVCCGCT